MSKPELLFSSAGFEEMFMSVQRRTEMLEKTIFGKNLDWNELHTFASYLDSYKGAKGSTVCSEGDSDAFLCVVCSGRINIHKNSINHCDKIIATLGPGNTLGEMSLVDGEPRSATAIVHTPVELLILGKAGFSLLADEYPRLWGKIIATIAITMSKRLRLTSGVLAEYLEN